MNRFSFFFSIEKEKKTREKKKEKRRMAESVDRNTIQGNASGEYDFEAMLEAALKESGQGQLPPPPPPPQTEHQTLPQPQQQQAQPQPPAATPGTAPAPTAQEQQDLGFDPSILEQPLAQRLQNRNFKVKVHAAKCIVEKIKEGVFPPEKAELEGLVKMTSDSAPLSQEAGLTTLDFIFATALNDSTTEHAKTEALLGTKEALKVDVLATSLIEKCLGNARPKPREQGLTVLLYLVQIDEQEVVTVRKSKNNSAQTRTCMHFFF